MTAAPGCSSTRREKVPSPSRSRRVSRRSAITQSSRCRSVEETTGHCCGSSCTVPVERDITQVPLRLDVAAQAEQHRDGARPGRGVLARRMHGGDAGYCCADWSPGSGRDGERRGGSGGSATGSSPAGSSASQGKRGSVRTAFSSLRDQFSWISA